MNKIYQKSFHSVKNAGFTLIELLVVVLIIGILAAVAFPQYQMAVYKARFSKSRPLVDALAQAEEVYYLANGEYTRDVHNLDIDIPADCVFTNPSADSDGVVSCKDIDIRIGYGAGRGVVGVIKKCPVYEPGCVTYSVPYSVPSNVGNFVLGTRPSCMVSQAGMTEQARARVDEYGKKVCLSLGGVATNVIVGTAYAF